MCIILISICLYCFTAALLSCRDGHGLHCTTQGGHLSDNCCNNSVFAAINSQG